LQEETDPNDHELQSMQSEMKKSESFQLASTSGGGGLLMNPSTRPIIKIPSKSTLKADSKVSPDSMHFPNRPMYAITKHPSSKSMSKVEIDPKVFFKIDAKISNNPTTELRKIPPFKKTQSQSQFQLKAHPTTHIVIEHETKNVKRSRSFDRSIDRNSPEQQHRHMIDNKKNQNKALNRPQKK
jgi:hypothetical protein